MAGARRVSILLQILLQFAVVRTVRPNGDGHIGPADRSQATVFMQMQTALAPGISGLTAGGEEAAHSERSLLQEKAAILMALPGKVYDQIALNLPYSNLWGEIETFPARRPRTFNVGLATVKTWTADLVVQFGEAKGRQSADLSKGWFDWRRSITFALFGFFYIGFIQWILYVTALSVLCPHAITFGNEPLSEKLVDQAGQSDLLKQIGYDNLVINPAIYFPVFYVIKGALQSAEASKLQEGSSVMSRITGPLRRYAKNFWEDNAVSVAVWVPVDVVVFSAPMYLRMPLDHAFSFLWTMLLSYRRGSNAGSAK